MKNITLPISYAVLALASCANAQTGTYSWQVSTDGGSSWGSLALAAPGSTIKVRLLASWSGITGSSLGYAGGQFDGTLAGATMLDTVSNIRKFVPSIIEEPRIIATPYSGGLKLDTEADLDAPGAGTGWINPGQAAADFAAPGTYISDNPAAIFTYDLLWNSANTIEVGMVANPTVGRAMAIYTSSAGAQMRLSTTSVSITSAIITIPAPSALAVLLGAAMAGSRRYRNSPLRT